MPQTQDLSTAYLADVRRTFKNYKAMGDAALAQTPDDHLTTELDPNSNSVAVIAKHVGGNLRSRFQDFLTTDGEKPDRNRDSEFELSCGTTRADVVTWWEAGWAKLTEALDALTPPDLTRTIQIRREEFLVVEALNRSAAHTAYHVGQMVYLARHFAGERWKTLSIPKGQSAQFSQGAFKQGQVEQLARQTGRS